MDFVPFPPSDPLTGAPKRPTSPGEATLEKRNLAILEAA